MIKSIVEIVKEKYPELAARVEVVRDGNQVTGEIPFQNQRYRLWFVEDGDGYIVGINFSHSHFDCDTIEGNLSDAMNRVDDILKDRIVAIGNRRQKEDYILVTMEREEGLRRYGLDDPRVEVVWFSREC